jgi:Uma2 family endonuclease
VTTSTPSSRIAQPGKFHDAQEWLHALGDVPPSRIVMDPWPGTATEQDLLQFVERDKRLVELIDGTLVEKPVGWIESQIALILANALLNFIKPRKLGYLTGADGTLRMRSGRVRLPDLAFVSIDDLAGGKRPTEAIPQLLFRLAVEVYSEGNTQSEMRQKRKEYFESGTRLVWIVYPATRTVEVFDQPTDQPARTLGELDTLDGGTVLPGFALRVAELFADL